MSYAVWADFVHQLFYVGFWTLAICAVAALLAVVERNS